MLNSYLKQVSNMKGSSSNSASKINPLGANPTKWSNTQTIRRQFADELFECLTILWNWRLKG